MRKLTTQATIKSFTNQGDAIIHSVMTFIKQIDNIDLNDKKIIDIKTALSEAINNVVIFAYPNQQGKVSVDISIYDNKVIKLKVCDFGCGIEDIDKAKTPLFSTQKDLAGMGFTIMESFSDKLTVKSTLRKGTIVTMEFKM